MTAESKAKAMSTTDGTTESKAKALRAQLIKHHRDKERLTEIDRTLFFSGGGRWYGIYVYIYMYMNATCPFAPTSSKVLKKEYLTP